MAVCSICHKKKEKGKGAFFKVPKDQLERWSQICRIPLYINSYICSDHFRSNDIATIGKRVNLLPIAQPIVEYNEPHKVITESCSAQM